MGTNHNKISYINLSSPDLKQTWEKFLSGFQPMSAKAENNARAINDLLPHFTIELARKQAHKLRAKTRPLCNS